MIREVRRSNLTRMYKSAVQQAEHIEIIQRALVEGGKLKEASEQQLNMRDDFLAMARLIDAIERSQELLKLVAEALRNADA